MNNVYRLENIESSILNIPAWRRFITCVILERKKWKTARAYSRVVADMICNGIECEEIRDRERRKWADLYGIELSQNMSTLHHIDHK